MVMLVPTKENKQFICARITMIITTIMIITTPPPSPHHQVVYIAVGFQLKNNDNDVSVRDPVCVGLYDTGKCSLLDAGWQSMCRLDTRAEVLRDLDAEWEVTITSSKTDHEAAISRSTERDA